MQRPRHGYRVFVTAVRVMTVRFRTFALQSSRVTYGFSIVVIQRRAFPTRQLPQQDSDRLPADLRPLLRRYAPASLAEDFLVRRAGDGLSLQIAKFWSNLVSGTAWRGPESTTLLSADPVEPAFFRRGTNRNTAPRDPRILAILHLRLSLCRSPSRSIARRHRRPLSGVYPRALLRI
jgi:hypothetical protein